jgi:hypothetical protein
MKHLNIKLNQFPFLPLIAGEDIPPPSANFLVTIDGDNVVTIDGSKVIVLE